MLPFADKIRNLCFITWMSMCVCTFLTFGGTHLDTSAPIAFFHKVSLNGETVHNFFIVSFFQQPCCCTKLLFQIAVLME